MMMRHPLMIAAVLGMAGAVALAQAPAQPRKARVRRRADSSARGYQGRRHHGTGDVRRAPAGHGQNRRDHADRFGAEARHARRAPARGRQMRARLHRRGRPLRSGSRGQHRSGREPSVPHGRHPEPRGRRERPRHDEGDHDAA